MSNPESSIQHRASSIQHPASRTAAFITLGCKVNQYETQVMREALKKQGYRIVAPDQVADVYVINTCTVTGISDRKSRQMIRRSVALNPDAIVVVTGCYAERSPDEIRDMPGVDLVLSNRGKPHIGKHLNELVAEIPLNPPLQKGEFHDQPTSPPLEGGHANSPFYETRVRGDLTEANTDEEIPLNPPLQKGEFHDQSASLPLEGGHASSPPLEKGGQGGFDADAHSSEVASTPPVTPILAFPRQGGRESDISSASLPDSEDQPSSSPFEGGHASSPPLEKGGQGGFDADAHSSEVASTPPVTPILAFPRQGGRDLDISSASLPGDDSIWHPGISSFDDQTRALVKIEDGCDSFCTYCIVPHVRGGKIRSRPMDSIVREVRSLAQNGHREVVLTGIHLGAYGRDMTHCRPLASPNPPRVRGDKLPTQNHGTTLPGVLRAVHDMDGIQRIRLSSMEPMDVSDDLISEMARLPKCAHHFHVSLQSGSDKILKLMRRGYTSAEFEDLVSRIRSAMPDVGLSTDVMVGFPGETEQDFRDTCDLIERVEFSRLHVFRYSPRRGTPAAEFPDRVQDSVASRRSQEARALGDSLAREFRSRMLGQMAEVLVEDSREGKGKLLAGFTGNYVRVLVADATDELAGRIVQVKLTDIEDDYMIGELNE